MSFPDLVAIKASAGPVRVRWAVMENHKAHLALPLL